MSQEQLILDIQNLHDLLEGSTAVDECTAASMDQIARDLELALAQAEGKLPETHVEEQLEAEILRFGDEHPALSQALKQILNTLHNIGI